MITDISKLAFPSNWDKILPPLCASSYDLGSPLTLCRQQKLSQSGAGVSPTNQSMITTRKLQNTD